MNNHCLFHIWLYFILPSLRRSVTCINFTYSPNNTDNKLHLLGFFNDTIFLRDQFNILHLDSWDLRLTSTDRVCPESCITNSIVLLNNIENVVLVCNGVDNSFCSAKNLSGFTSNIQRDSAGISSSVSLAVSSAYSRPAIGVVADDGTMYVAVTYGPGIKTDRHGGNVSFHETYKYVITRITLNGGILNREKSFPFRLPRNVHLNDYLIFFKGVFQTERHIFFITNQKFKVGLDQIYTSKLTSFCKNDPYFYSYTDFVLECRNGEKRYNLIQDSHVFKPSLELMRDFNLHITEKEELLAGIFASGDDPDNPQPPSAVCLYSFKDIRRTLKETREEFIVCPGSNLTENERYLDNNILGGCLAKEHFNVRAAESTGFGSDCNTIRPLNSYVIGEVGLSADASYVLDTSREHLTKVFLQTHGHLNGGNQTTTTVLYAGTSKGKLLTMNLISSNSVKVFDEKDVDPGHPIEAVHVDKEHNIFALSLKQLVKYGVFDCDRYKSCEAVTYSFNPFCGWCVYESRPVHLENSTCLNTDKPNHLMSYREKCVSLDLKTHAFEVKKATQVYFDVGAFPEPLTGDEYFCQFTLSDGSVNEVAVAKRGGTASFTCNTPLVSRNSKAVIVLLVSTTSTFHQSRQNVTLASSSIIFYDCLDFNSCNDCTKNKHYNCIWYLKEGLCQSKTDPVIKAANVSEALSCPFVINTTEVRPFIHANIPTTLFVAVANIYEFMEVTCCAQEYGCSPAIFVNVTMIQCIVQINTNTSLLTLSLQIKYAGYFLNGTQNEVTVYNCGHLASDCSECRALSAKEYKCQWCHMGHSSVCAYSSAEDCVPADNCPPPVITKIFPNTAPIFGGTNVTISGHEMGTSSKSVSSIELAGVQCNLLPKKYVVSKLVVCNAGSMNISMNETELKGPVQMTIDNLTLSELSFTYKNPRILKVHPVSGPRAGGTVMTLTGRSLDIGNRKILTCFITDDEQRVCRNATFVKTFHASLEDRIKVVMSPAGQATVVTKFEVIFDDNTVKTINTTYEFLQDPVVETIHPRKSIYSGGIKVTVFGRHMKNANHAKILISHQHQTKFRRCKFKSDKQVVCRTPSLLQLDNSFKSSHEVVDSAVHLDGVTKTFDLEYFLDPKLGTTDFVNTSTILDVISGFLFVEGQNITLAATLSDIRIQVGLAGCPIVSLNETHIKCQVPVKHLWKEEVGDSLLQVNVTIGDLRRLVGYIQPAHVVTDGTSENSSFLLVIFLSSLTGLFGVIVLALVIRSLKVCMRKNRERLRYLTMRSMDGNDTPILPSRERRQSNCNIYEVISDLPMVENRTHSEDTYGNSEVFKRIQDEEPEYQTLDASPNLQRWEIPQRRENLTSSETDTTSDLEYENDENSAQTTTFKDYYLSPVMLKETVTTVR